MLLIKSLQFLKNLVIKGRDAAVVLVDRVLLDQGMYLADAIFVIVKFSCFQIVRRLHLNVEVY